MNIADGLIISHSVTSMEGSVELPQLRFSLSIGRELLVANNTNHEILSSIIGSRTSPTVSDEDIRALTQRNTIQKDVKRRRILKASNCTIDCESFLPKFENFG